MATIETLRAEVERIVSLLPGPPLYIRSGAGAEAEQYFNQSQTDQFVFLHTDQTTVETVPAEVGNRVTKVIPLEIHILYPDDIDSPLSETDSIVNDAENLADEFYDRLIQSEIIDEMVALSEFNYNFNRIDSYKVYSTILSGGLITMDVPVRRLTYYCAS